MRHDHDPFYQEIYVKKRITPDMRFLEKMAVLAKVEKEISKIRKKTPAFPWPRWAARNFLKIC